MRDLSENVIFGASLVNKTSFYDYFFLDNFHCVEFVFWKEMDEENLCEASTPQIAQDVKRRYTS